MRAFMHGVLDVLTCGWTLTCTLAFLTAIVSFIAYKYPTAWNFISAGYLAGLTWASLCDRYASWRKRKRQQKQRLQKEYEWPEEIQVGRRHANE